MRMIISASRRTDIPNYYSDWFFRRLKEKYVLVRNPVNPRQVGRLDLSPAAVDGIVFVTKNPLPMLPRLDELRDYTFYFQFTVTSYGSDIELNIPSKNDVIIPAFRRLADAVGPDRIIWRYDPILLSEKYPVDYHIEYFDRIAEKLSGFAKRCTISFVDVYRSIEPLFKTLKIREPTDYEKELLARHLAESARRYGLEIDTCAEAIDLSKYGIGHGRCVDAGLLGRLRGYPVDVKKSKPQRAWCGCDASLDIGAYGTCRSGCVYCYASGSAGRTACGRPASPMLCSSLGEGDRVTQRPVKSDMSGQLSLPDDV